MAKKVHRIHSMPGDAPWDSGLPPAGSDEHPLLIRTLDRVLSIQRPVVVAHLRSVRLRHPDASTAEIARILERRYLAAVTTGGAAVGATAVIPGIGTGVTLALSGAETVTFLEATTLFAQSLAELHGIPVSDPNRARALVLTLMMGQEGVDLVAQLGRQLSGEAVPRDKYWGDIITTSLPRAAVGPLADKLKRSFIRQFAARGGASVLGKAIPFGIGAAIGGAGNHLLGRRVIVGSRRAFGVVPEQYPPELEPRPGAERIERATVRGLRAAGGVMIGGASGAARAVGRAAQKSAAAVSDAGRAATRAFIQGKKDPEAAGDDDPAPIDASPNPTPPAAT